MKGNGIRKNTIINCIKTIFGIIFPLISFPYVSRVLMAENLGKISFSGSVVNYFSLIASLGISTYAIRECSKVRNNQYELEKTASQILSINLFSTIISYLLLFLTLFVACPLDNYKFLICLQSVSILFATIGADWINSAMEDFSYIAIRTVLTQLLSLIMMFVFVKEPGDYLKYVLICILSSSGANLINIFYRRRYCKMHITLHMDLKKHLPPILLMFSMILSQTVYTNSDTLILGFVKGDYEVGLYSAAVRVYSLVNSVIASIAWVVMPQLSSAFSQKSYEDINSILKYSLNFILVLGIPCIVGINSLALPIIDVLAGSEFHGAVIALHIFSITLAFSLIGGWVGNMTMLPAGREKITLFTCCISAIVNFILNLILIPLFGLNAAAFTTAVAEFIGACILFRNIDRNIRITDLFEMLKAPIIGSLSIIIISFITRMCIHSNILVCVVTIVASVISYLSILIAMKNEFIIGYLKPIYNKIKR